MQETIYAMPMLLQIISIFLCIINVAVIFGFSLSVASYCASDQGQKAGNTIAIVAYLVLIQAFLIINMCYAFTNEITP